MFPETVTAEPELLTYLTDSVQPAPGQPAPRVGDVVELRVRRGGLEVEAWSAAGTKLGRLPPSERAALEGLLPRDETPLHGHISAVVPRPLLLAGGRIHIRFSTPQAWPGLPGP